MDRRRAEQEIVEAGRRMYAFRLIVGLDGNLSARLGPDRILTTPAGTCKGFLSPRELVLVDLQGRPLEGGRPSTELDMHLAIYHEREDVDAVVHGHPPHATAFAAAGVALEECLLPEVVVSLGAVPVSGYGTPSTHEVGDAVRRVAREHDAFLLRNHGAVVSGRGVLQTYYKLETVEQLARITLLARQLGGGKPLTAEQVEALHAVREVYGLERRAPSCVPGENGPPGATAPASPAGPSTTHAVESDSTGLARLVAEEIARALPRVGTPDQAGVPSRRSGRG